MTNITQSLKIVLLAIVLSFGISYVFAWAPPTATPTEGNSFAPLNTSNVDQIKNGNLFLNALGITNTAIGALSVAGGITLTPSSGGIIFPDGTTQATAATTGGIPSGAVMFFNLPSCPLGWSEATSVRGRYIVGLPLGGSLGGTAGIALSNLENRPVGQHSHVIASGPAAMLGSTGPTEVGTRQYTGAISFSTDPYGNVSGTNAPYIQYLACQKI